LIAILAAGAAAVAGGVFAATRGGGGTEHPRQYCYHCRAGNRNSWAAEVNRHEQAYGF
jgi:hypothetical protein